MKSARYLLAAAAILLLVGCVSGAASPTPEPLADTTGDVAPVPSRPEASGAAAAGAAVPSAESSEGLYRIGTDDVLFISVWREEGLSRVVRVRPDGRISFPLVGDVRAAGLTAPELERELARRLQAYITAPAVSVIVEEVNSYKVYVLGEVMRPGQLAVKSPVTVLQALALAGGLKPFAAGNRIVLIRARGGRTERIRLDYNDLVRGRNGAIDLTLESGDTLVVP